MWSVLGCDLVHRDACEESDQSSKNEMTLVHDGSSKDDLHHRSIQRERQEEKH